MVAGVSAGRSIAAVGLRLTVSVGVRLGVRIRASQGGDDGFDPGGVFDGAAAFQFDPPAVFRPRFS
jgi:hypothetical protein